MIGGWCSAAGRAGLCRFICGKTTAVRRLARCRGGARIGLNLPRRKEEAPERRETPGAGLSVCRTASPLQYRLPELRNDLQPGSPISRFSLSWASEQEIPVSHDQTRVNDVDDAEHEIERDPENDVQ